MIPDKYVGDALMALKPTVIWAEIDSSFIAWVEKAQPHVSLALKLTVKINHWRKKKRQDLAAEKEIQSNVLVIILWVLYILERLNIILKPL